MPPTGGVQFPAHDRMPLERLARYAGRPSLSIVRLSLLPDGRLLYRLKRRCSDGTSHMIFEPLELVERLAALVPRPRVNLVRYFGVLGPAARFRPLAAGQLKRILLPQSSSPFLGYARLTLLAGAGQPSATAVIRRWENGSPASEAGIPATPAIGEQLSLVADRPGQRTGLAILNPSDTSASVDLELLGSEAGVSLPGKISLSLGPGEKLAKNHRRVH